MNTLTSQNRLRVLLVDDDIDFVASLSGMLEQESYPTATAHSSAQALSLMEAFEPDVALVDIRLGRESGLDLIAQLQEFESELTCVVITAYADTETAIEALKSGVYDYLRKPFEPSALYAVLQRCVERHKLLVEKKAAEEARRESEARFKLAFETSPDAIILAYPGGDIIDVNPGFEELTGYRRDQVVGRNSQEVGLWKNPADRALLMDLLKKLGQVNNLQSEFRLSDGRIRIGLVSARVVEHENEKIGLFVVRDVHDVKLKEKAIMESEERFRSLVSNIPGAVYRCQFDRNWTMHYISAPIRDLSGYRAADFVHNRTRSFASIIHSDDIDHLNETVAAAVSNKKSFMTEFRIVHSDGSVRWVENSGRAIFDEDGTPLSLDGVILDITSNKKALEDLADSEKRFRKLAREHRAVLEGIPDAIFLIDQSRSIVWANRGAAHHFSRQQQDLAGMDVVHFWRQSNEQIIEAVNWVFETDSPVELLQNASDGRKWGIKMFPVEKADGVTPNMILIASDLTEKFRLREQARRSAHLAALGELAAGVAHEINNPTGMILVDMPMLEDAINDLLPLLEEHEPDLKDKKLGGLTYSRFRQEVPLVIEEIQEGAQRIKRIVEELKDFSRPSTGELETLDLNEVMQKAVSLVRNPLKKATDHFSDGYASVPLWFSGNSQRMEQVMVNLLLNACHALPDRSKAIRAETGYSENGKFVKVTISDEGVGIPSEAIKQVTDPFFTTRRDSGGTGLGLSVSSRIIDEHNGTLTFDSEPGKGTAVTVELPAVEATGGTHD